MDPKVVILLLIIVLAAAGAAVWYFLYGPGKKATPPAPATLTASTPTTSGSPAAPSPAGDEEDPDGDEEDPDEYDTIELGETYEGSGGGSDSDDGSGGSDSDDGSGGSDSDDGSGGSDSDDGSGGSDGDEYFDDWIDDSDDGSGGSDSDDGSGGSGDGDEYFDDWIDDGGDDGGDDGYVPPIPPPPPGSPKAKIKCGAAKKTATVIVTSNPKKVKMSLFSPQRKTNGGLVKGGIVSGTVKVGPLAWIDPKKKTFFYLATSPANYKAKKYIAACATGKSPTAAGKPSASIDCKKTNSNKSLTITVRKNPKKIKMSLFSPEKKTGGGLIKAGIVSGTVKVGPLAWIDPKKPTRFVLAASAKDYKAKKAIAKCSTKKGTTTSGTKPVIVINCNNRPNNAKSVMVQIKKNPKNVPMKLFSPQKPGNDGLIKYNIKTGSVTVGPLGWMDLTKDTTFVVALTTADYKAKKYVAKCVRKGTKKQTTPPKKTATKPPKKTATKKTATKPPKKTAKAPPKKTGPKKPAKKEKFEDYFMDPYNLIEKMAFEAPVGRRYM